MSAVELLQTRLDELDVALFAKDAAGSKAALSALLDHATRHPRAVLRSLVPLGQALADENYSKRNAVVQIMAGVVERIKDGERVQDEVDGMEEEKDSDADSDEDDEDDDSASPAEVAAKRAAKQAAATAAALKDQAESKAAIVAILHARIHDINSFTRIKTLQALLALVRARALSSPADFVSTLRAAQDRLMDKTASVRKAAIQLLTALMEMNPFAPVLDLAKFRARLQGQADAFREAMAKAPANQMAAKGGNRRSTLASTAKGEEGDEEDVEPGAEESKEEQEEAKDDAASVDASPAFGDHSLKALLGSALLSDLALEKLRSELHFLFHGVTFVTALAHQVLPLLYELLGSKTHSDAIECVHFFVAAKQFQLSAPVEKEAPADDDESVKPPAAASALARVTVDLGCKKLAGLIWSREAAVRDAVLAAWVTLYLGEDLSSRSGPVAKKGALVSIHALVQLVRGASLAELTSMEEICTKLFYAGHIPPVLVSTLWDLFSSVECEVSAEARTTFLMLLNFFANASGFVLANNATEIITVGFADASLVNAPTLVRQACISMQKWVASIQNAPTPAEAPPAPPRATLEVLFSRMRLVLTQTTSPSAQVASGWYSAAEAVLGAVFALHETPEEWAEGVLHELVRTVFAPSNAAANPNAIGNAEKLSRFLFLLSHTALRTLVHLESLEKDIKSLRNKKAAAGAAKELQAAEEEAAPVKKGRGKKAAATPAPAPMATSIEDDLATTQAAEYELEQAREACEMELISARAGARGLLSVFAPVVLSIVRQLPLYAAHRNVQSNAVLALCKLMVINVAYAEGEGAQEHLCLLFGVLKSASTSATIKGNIIVAVGDLFLRFPNSVEPFSEHMYHGLAKGASEVLGASKGHNKGSPAAAAAPSAEETFVRKNTLMVLTHLILTDMLKAKGALAELAKCTQDVVSAVDPSPTRIAQLSQAFFQELNSKSGDSKATIYNILPDILSRLSSDPRVSRREFQAIFKFLLAFLAKEKQIDALIEKLITRFENVATEGGVGEQQDGGRQLADIDAVMAPSADADAAPVAPAPTTPSTHPLRLPRDLSFCLSALSFSPASLRKLLSLFRCYAPSLGDAEVYANFMTVLAKARKGLGKEGKAEKADAGGDGSAAAPASSSAKADSPGALLELKQLLDDVETKIQAQHIKLAEDQAVATKARAARGRRGYGDRVAGEEHLQERKEAEEEGEEEEEDDEENVPPHSARNRKPVAAASKGAKGKTVAASKKPSAAAAAAAAKSRGRKKVVSSEDEADESSEDDEEVEEESEEEEEEEEEAPKPKKKAVAPAPKKKAAAAAAPAKAPAKARRRKIVEDSDDDE